MVEAITDLRMVEIQLGDEIRVDDKIKFNQIYKTLYSVDKMQYKQSYKEVYDNVENEIHEYKN